MSKKVELPDASEVHKLVPAYDEKEFDKIANAIIRKVKQRQSVLHWPYEVSEPVRQELHKKGYLSEPSIRDRDGWLTTFNWPRKI